MTLRFSKIFLILFCFFSMTAGLPVEAQESASQNEGIRTQPLDLNLVEFDALQIEIMRKFLQDYRLELRKFKSDLSVVVKEVRRDFKNIKQEHKRTLQGTKKLKTPVLIKRKTFPAKKEILPSPKPSTDHKHFFPEQKIFEPQKPQSKDKLLSLNERQRQAKIENALQGKFLRTQNTELGRLKVEMENDPLKSYQVKLTQFGEKINNLLGQLQGEGGVQRSVFLDLGNTHLESQRYLNSLNADDRWKLTRYASDSGTVLGSYESALWVLKMALARNPDDAETNLLLGKILSETGEQDLALRRARNAEHLFVKNSQPGKAGQARSFIESLKSSFPKR